MKKFIIGALALFPAVASAQNLSNLRTLLSSVGDLVDIALPIVVALALLAFFWGLVRFIFGGAEDHDKARNLMIWGLVALFVMVSVWGLVRFIGNALGINPTATPETVPFVPTPNTPR